MIWSIMKRRKRSRTTLEALSDMKVYLESIRDDQTVTKRLFAVNDNIAIPVPMKAYAKVFAQSSGPSHRWFDDSVRFGGIFATHHWPPSK